MDLSLESNSLIQHGALGTAQVSVPSRISSDFDNADWTSSKTGANYRENEELVRKQRNAKT